ncbi:type IV secretion system DNA-binding domain-containing protein [Candidatus Falkowbacteria bacterium]|nr:type IV secretion system DNA-binding domain-containing protein [Candidatus Falkowbacteria bacterium]
MDVNLPSLTFDPNVQINLEEGIFSSPIILGLLIFLAMFFVLWMVISFLRWTVRRKGYLNKKYQKVILRITLPKFSKKDEKLESRQQIQEKIAVAEVFFSTLAGIKPQKGFSAWFWGREDHLAVEIVAEKGKIYFYVAVPEYLEQYIEEQIHAQYPHSHIEAMEDYNIFSPKGVIMGSALVFTAAPFFPIRTYKKVESDPLNALTNALNKISAQDGGAIQIIVRPTRSGWMKMGVKLASKMNQGKKLKEALREIAPGPWAAMMRFFRAIPTGKDTTKQPKEQYHLSAMEQEMLKNIEEKSSKGGMDVNIRLITSSENPEKAQMYLDGLLNAFNQFSVYEYGNSFKPIKYKIKNFARDFIYRNFIDENRIILNTEELASIFHLPLPNTETPNIQWLEARRATAPLNLPEQGIVLGENIYRGIKRVVRMKKKDRQRHMYIIGQTGTGKSYFMMNCLVQDINNGEGVCIIDPHGDLIDEALQYIPKERADDVILFDPSDIERPMGLNMLEFYTIEQKTFVVNEMMNIFDKLYDLRQTGGPIFEQYMRNTMMLLMEDPDSGSTLMEVPKALAQEDFRKMKLAKTKNPVVKDFWEKEAQKAGGEASLQNMVPYITSKLNQFVANDIMRPIIGQQKSAFNFREAMDEGKIILVKLSKGKIGDINAYLLGMVIVGKILMAALSRVDTPEKERRDFFLYIDEFQNFLTEGISIILSEARKYKLDLIIAHQFIGQLVKANDTRIRDAIFGNVGTTVCFRIGVDDAELIAKRFAPVFDDYDVQNIPNANAYIRLLIDNANPPAFNLFVPARDYPMNPELGEKIRQLSRLKYGRAREIVEQEIFERGRVI